MGVHGGRRDTHASDEAPSDGTTRSGPHAEAPGRVRAHSAGFLQIFPRRLDGSPPAWTVVKPAEIGRSRKAQIRIEDARVSRVHAHVEPVSGGFTLRDPGSRHGTFVNAAPVTGSVHLTTGDVLRVGDVLLLVTDDVTGHAVSPRKVDGTPLGLEKGIVAGPRFAQAIDHAARLAELPDPVLVLGESGTGKEIIARVIHAARKPRGPFVGINIAAIPPTLFEAELFGHERGAFTGAVIARPGAFREATNGVLFLDEVADLPFDLQAKLLRVIDLQRVRPIGASADVKVKVRLVAATSRDLRYACETGVFRPDLFYRLAGVIVEVPPLRERRDEILLLALAMLQAEAPGLRLSTDAAELLAIAPWRGNVRNLRRAVTHAIAEAVTGKRDSIKPADLPELQPIEAGPARSPGLTPEGIRAAMMRADGVAWRAARELGVSRSTFYNACKRLRIEPGSLRTS